MGRLRLRRLLYALQRIGLCGLEAEVKVEQLAPHPRPDVELVVQRQTRKLAQQVRGVVVQVDGVVQHGVGVGEYILGADAVRVDLVEVLAPLLTVVVVDTPDAPVGDVADALTLGRVAVEGQALRVACEVIINQPVCGQSIEVLPVHTETYDFVLVCPVAWEYLRHLVSAMRHDGRIVGSLGYIWSKPTFPISTLQGLP